MPLAPALYTITTVGAASVSVVVPELATEDVMGSSILNLIAVVAVMVAMQVPAPAQENPAQAPAQASPPQTAPPQTQLAQPTDSDNRRFVFHRIDGSFLRLDMRTGAVAACSPKGTDWTCVPGRDERAALDHEIAQLQRDNAILKNALLEHRVPLPDGMAPSPPSGAGTWGGDETIPRPPQTVPPTAAAPGTPAPGASHENEIDRIMNAVERGWRRLVEVMTDLQHNLQKKE